MPDWVPWVAPDLCPRCGAYWECEHADEVPLSFGDPSDPIFSREGLIVVDTIRMASWPPIITKEDVDGLTQFIGGIPAGGTDDA